MEKPRRNYIRRKRCFNECTNLIARTLRVIKQAQQEPFTEASINELAASHASQIEAACWSPRSKMTDEDYKALTMSKTIELCYAIIRKSLKLGEQAKLKLLIFIANPHFKQSLQRQIPAAPPPPSSEPVVIESDHGHMPELLADTWDFGLPQLDDGPEPLAF